MPRRRESTPAQPTSPRRPATTPDARENQLIAAAVDLAEQQILNGTASAQVISHFLKLGSSRERAEQERLRLENELTAAKVEALASQARIEELYTKALHAMSGYKGHPMPEVDEGYED